MIQRIPSWTWSPRGGGITLTPPGGGAVIRYRERVRPLQTVAGILRDRAADTRFRATSVSPIESLVTAEGEYAAVVDVQGVLDAAPEGGSATTAARTLGFVFADDWYSEVAGIALREALVAPVKIWVRRLIHESQLMLGIRRRRFVYEPPPGWYGYARLPLFMTWFPPEYPRDATSITVYPALPAPVGVDEAPHFGMIPVGPPATAEVLAEVAARAPLEHGRLTGFCWELLVRDERGRNMQRSMVMLRDDRYLYVAYLDRDSATAAPGDEGALAFATLLTSIASVPQPRAVAASTGLAEDWF